MNILIFAPSLPSASNAAMAQRLATGLAQAGHRADLVSPDTGHAADVATRAVQADLVVHQLGAEVSAHAAAWMARLPGVLWICSGDALATARHYGAQALGVLAPAGSDLQALLPCCPGPVLAAESLDAGAALLRLGAAAQRAAPVIAAADEMAAILRAWGADDAAVAACGLADGFDLFRA